MQEEEDLVFASDEGGHSEEDDIFDTIVGAIQNIIVDGGESSEFSRLMDTFLKTHSPVFDDSEENKLEYMEIFKKYNETIERFLEKKLSEQIEEFSMSMLMELLKTRDEVDLQGDVFELLYSFSDFNIFKELVLDYKRATGRGISKDDIYVKKITEKK